MDREDWCGRNPVEARPLRWDLRPQGHRLRICCWISVEFKLFLIKEFQRLKEDENRRLSLAWNLNRTLSKLNYRIQTDAIQARLIPPEVTPARPPSPTRQRRLAQCRPVRPDREAVAGCNRGLDGNMRDHATVEQLVVLANIEA